MTEWWEKDIVRGDDGDYLYWPEGDGGAYPAYILRAIAAHLDKLNIREMQEFRRKVKYEMENPEKDLS